MQGFIYILQSQKNGRCYVGSTNDIVRRKAEHDRGHVVATRHLRPLELAFYQEYPSAREAGRVERWLKRLKDRSIIDRIIASGRIDKQFE